MTTRARVLGGGQPVFVAWKTAIPASWLDNGLGVRICFIWSNRVTRTEN